MNRTNTWTLSRKWIAGAAAALALAAPISDDPAAAAAPGRFTRSDASGKKAATPGKTDFRKKKDAPTKSGSTRSAERNRAKKDQAFTPLVTRLVSAGSAGGVSGLDATAVREGLKLVAVLDQMRTSVRKMKGATDRRVEKTLRRRYRRRLRAAISRYESAEAELSHAENAMWNGFQADFTRATVVDQPLAAALLQLQIELRRILGVRFHTTVPNLREMPGCAGDLIRDRLIARYGEAVLELSQDRSAEVEVLRQIATQLACISAEQSRRFDYALYTAYYRAFDRLGAAGLKRVQPAFARLVAPLMLLVHDTVKHRGHAAGSWWWFEDHKEILLDEVGRLGWATGNVYWMYDRIEGQLIGFPACDASGSERCIDPDVLIESLRDPLALGLGDCALSAMVARGVVPMGRHGDRYACPPSDCDAAAASPIPNAGGAGSPRGSAGSSLLSDDAAGGGNPFSTRTGSAAPDLPWYGIGPSDHATMQLGCGGSGGGTGGGEAGPQGPGGALGSWGGMQECMEEYLSQPASPFHAHAQCIVDSAASNHDPLDPGSSLRGVPMDPQCSIMDGNGDETDGTSGTDGNDGTDDAGTDAGEKEEPSLGQKVWNAIKTFFSIPTSPSGPGAVVGVELELLDPENGKKIYDTAGALVMNRLEKARALGDISDAEYNVLQDQKPADVASYLKNKGAYECANETDCSDSCTALNSQLAERRACDQQFLEDITPPEYQDDGDPNDPLINWGPDGNPGEQGQIDGVIGCMLDQAGGGPDTNPQCGVVQCADGLATAWSAGSCCSDLGGFTGDVPVSNACWLIQCADGNPVVGTNGMCACGTQGGGVIGDPTPPVGPERGPGGLLLDLPR